MSKPRVYRVLLVASGSSSTAVGDAVMALVTRDRVAPDELHVLVPAVPADRVRAALLKPGSASSLTAVCRRLGIARNDIICGLRTFHGLGASGEQSAPPLLGDEGL